MNRLNELIKIKDVETKEEAKKVDSLLTELIHFEKRFNNNINDSYIVNNYYNVPNNEECLAIAIKNNIIIGYIYGYVLKSKAYINDIGKIGAVYIKEEYRGLKLGTSLIEYFKKWCKNKEIKVFEIEVLAENENAKKLYKKLGFKVNRYSMTMENK